MRGVFDLRSPRSNQLRRAIARLHAAKTADYGNAWKKRGEVLSVLANEARKVDRIEELGARKALTKDESLFDTYLDLLVYLVKHQTLLADEDPAVAKVLGLVGRCEQPYSERVGAFNILLDSIDLSPIDDVTKTVFNPAPVVAAFAALEDNFNGLTAAAPAVTRLTAVQDVISETVAALAGLIMADSSSFETFVAIQRAENGE